MPPFHPVEGFVHNGRTVFSLRYRLQSAPPTITELIVPLDADGNAIGPARPKDPNKHMVRVHPGESILHGDTEYRVLAVEVFRSLPLPR